ncbi:fungal-specific transcription factor domain-containing protein [Calycina marina]|uniref:Fungal-specific transcription factor domain-containing protein n=1 Tax=Calycina marina TaxID=1763456 RepID=A0A9P7Z8X5_9HELO|nr:fungal-specific transcription factor domain-containing protein [Calycina marina]
MSSSVKRACDACHRRKVKCDGINPCRNCSSAQLSCTYHAVPQKKGPKGSRAKVISELRENQRQSIFSAKVANRMNGVDSPPCSPTLAPTPGLLSTDMMRDCIEFFFANMYPTLPILHRRTIEYQSLSVETNVDNYCLLTSLCAFMMIQPGMGIPGDATGIDSHPGANLICSGLLLEETLRVRKSCDHLESPTTDGLVTSFFLFGCYFGLDQHNKAWFHLREATTLAHILDMQREETYLGVDVVTASRRRRLYWLLFVTERAYALQRHRPLSLQAMISLPTEHDDPSDTQSHQLGGFINLVGLFRPFDEQFVALWNKTRTDCSASYLEALEKQLSDAVPVYLNSTAENQTADLRASQQWLRTMVWQLSIQNGYLSSSHGDPNMAFQYSVEIACDLVAMTSQFSRESMDVHGIGLIEKLFDVACSLTNVLVLMPAITQPYQIGPRDYLDQFMTLLSILRRGDNRFLPLLLSKVNDVLPMLTNPMLQTVPDNAPPACEVDIFEGYGAIMAGMPNNFHAMASSMSGSSGSAGDNFKVASSIDFKIETPGLPFDKHIEGLNSPIHGPKIVGNSSFNTPTSVLGTQLEFPGLGEYAFPDMHAQHPHGNSNGHNLPSNNIISFAQNGQPGFKREFEHNMGMIPHSSPGGIERAVMVRPTIHTGMESYAQPQQQQMPRSVPLQGPTYPGLRRVDSGGYR